MWVRVSLGTRGGRGCCGVESGMSVLDRSVDTCVGEGGVGETEWVVSVDSVGVVCVSSSWVLVVWGLEGVRSAIHS